MSEPIEFLELNGVKASRASNDDVYDFVAWIAASSPDLDDITSRLRRVIQPARHRKQECTLGHADRKVSVRFDSRSGTSVRALSTPE